MGVSRGTKEVLQAMDKYRLEYELWREMNKELKMGFFPIFNMFKESHLSSISGGALKAYIYFGIHANNKTGESWHSAETMSEFFKVDLRTVKKWIKELEEIGLIARIQKGYKRVANTFLLPYRSVESIQYDVLIMNNKWVVNIDNRLEWTRDDLNTQLKLLLLTDILVESVPGALRISELTKKEEQYFYITQSTVPGTIHIGDVLIEFKDTDLKEMTIWIRNITSQT